MTDEQLGFDPTITSDDVNHYITITKESKKERLVIDDVITHHHFIAGRGTRCWKNHREVDELKRLLVVKDSWQYPERDEEGGYLREATNSGVVNVTRYYHHETVSVDGKDDTIVDNVQKGLDISKAENAYKVMKKRRKDKNLRRRVVQLQLLMQCRNQKLSTPAVSTTTQEDEVDLLLRDRVHQRVLMQDYGLTISTTTQEDEADLVIRDRVHRRVIVQDYGQPIYQASS